MAAPASSVATVPRTYAELRRAVMAVIVTGRQEVEEAWVRTYHETGRLIHEHVLLQRDRADYGAKVYPRLTTDTGVSSRTLHECVQFYRCYPIVRPVAQFGWNRCRLLCQVGDEKERAALVAEMKRGDLPTVELKAQVRELNAARAEAAESAAPTGPLTAVKALKPKGGRPGFHRVVARDDGLAVDVGFKLYLPLEAAPGGAAQRIKAGDLVSVGAHGVALAADATPADLFTYRATVRRVIDGDTLAVSIALPHYTMDEKLRLRGLDCPEIDTPEGRAAKRFVEGLFATAAEAIVVTSKVDKYDRYLADVFVVTTTGEKIFLNQALLAQGHAVPMGAEGAGEW